MSSPKKVLASVAAATALVASGAFVAPVQADTQGCVTWREWNYVRDTHKKSFVHELFDTRGTIYYSYNDGEGYAVEGREYRTCKYADRSYVTVDYEWDGDYWRVTDKSFSRF